MADIKPQIYLSGGFYQGYRHALIARLGDSFRFYDPEAAVIPQYPAAYIEADFAAIRASNLVVAYQDDYPYVYGMAAEMGYAAALNLPIIFVCRTKRIDSFLSGISRAVFTDLDSAEAFIRERYIKP